MVIRIEAEELEKICSTENVQAHYRNKYDVTEWYSIGKNLRDYSYFFPKKAKLPVFIDHGVDGDQTIYRFELEKPSQIYFTYNAQRKKNFKKLSKKQCEVIIFPNIYWRRKNKITPAPDAKGTIVYPFHTTPDVDDEMDVDKYMQQLKALPERFHPLTVSLHANDVNKGKHLKWLENGFKVVSAGHYADDRYCGRFYDILRRHKYATSNCIGSHTHFAVEMGIPFFVYGQREKYINKSDPFVQQGEVDSMKHDWYKKAYELFSVGNIETDEIKITEEQQKLTELNCGITEGISRLKFTFLLWYLFLRMKLNV